MIRPDALRNLATSDEGQPPTPAQPGGEAGGLRCRVCGLEDVPWPRTAYCSARCRRRAAYLARRQRRRGTAGRRDDGRRSRKAMR